MEFSVIIPGVANNSGIVRTRHPKRFLRRRRFPPLEILVIDDCSIDSTGEAVSALRREIPSLRLLSTPANGGPSAARNVGLREAKQTGSPYSTPTTHGSQVG